MKTKYGIARVVAEIISFLGWLDIIFAGIFFALAIASAGADSLFTTVMGIPVAIAVASGMFMIAFGQVVKAVVDMADNSFILLGRAEGIKEGE